MSVFVRPRRFPGMITSAAQRGADRLQRGRFQRCVTPAGGPRVSSGARCTQDGSGRSLGLGVVTAPTLPRSHPPQARKCRARELATPAAGQSRAGDAASPGFITRSPTDLSALKLQRPSAPSAARLAVSPITVGPPCRPNSPTATANHPGLQGSFPLPKSYNRRSSMRRRVSNRPFARGARAEPLFSPLLDLERWAAVGDAAPAAWGTAPKMRP